MAKTIKDIQKIIDQGPYEPKWASLQQQILPKWFKNDKFGVFIHWGLYSVPAHNNEWYSRNMYIKGMEEFDYHVKTYGNHKDFGYQHFINLFKAEKFDPKLWAKIIKDSGARYVFPVAEHHDGFQMYQSDISDWNAYKMGPKRDIILELKEAFLDEGLKFCTSTHRAEHWFFMSHGRKFDSDISDDLKKGDFYWPSEEEKGAYEFDSKPTPSKEFLEDWLERTVEIIDRFHPSILYFDWWIQHQAFKPYLKMLAAYYYNDAANRGQEVSISYKHDAFVYGSGIIEIERGKFSELKHFDWQTETAIANNSWCYTDSLDYKSTYEIITLLIDVVSKNGNLLLNIGPKANGKMPAYEVNLLKEVGNWLKINGQAIYESKPYLVFGEGPTKEDEGKFSEKQALYTSKDFRFTTNHGAIYVHVLNPKDEDTFIVKNLSRSTEHNEEGIFSPIEKITLLGSDEKITFKHEKDGLIIITKDKQKAYPIVFKVELL